MQLVKAGVHTPGRSPAARWGDESLQQYERLTTPADGRCFFHAIAIANMGYERWKQLTEHRKIATAKELAQSVAPNLPPEAAAARPRSHSPPRVVLKAH